jgi:cell division protein FtsB
MLMIFLLQLSIVFASFASIVWLIRYQNQLSKISNKKKELANLDLTIAKLNNETHALSDQLKLDY